MNPTPKSDVDLCICGSAKPATDCCTLCHEGTMTAATAEALIRSRYVAYALGLEHYLLETWHSTTRPESLSLDEEPRPLWMGLTIKHHELHGNDRAIVEFVARYKINGRAHRLHETSRFVREDGRWFYIDGDIEG